MRKIQTEHPNSLTTFIAIIEKYRKDAGHTLWFRGCGISSYPLKPSLYRNKKTKNIRHLVETEYKILTRFKQRSIPFHSISLENDWDTLFLMQHYGIPTRLLDWTESPFIALYFSLMSARRNSFAHKSAVWILDPIAWNSYVLGDQETEILSTSDSEIMRYKPQKKYEQMPDNVIPLYGAHNSQRIVAQRGVFVIFGSDTTSMRRQFIKNGFPLNCLIKIIFDRSVLPKVLDSILESGITESVVFPDLEGLAQEIRRIFGYGRI